MDTVRDFTKGNIIKIILGFYFPMFATNMLQQLYTFADTAVVGNGLGDNALAAVGNMGSLTFLIIGFSLGLSIGFSVLIAQYFGAKDYRGLKQVLASSLVLAAIITIVLTILSNLFLKDILVFLRTDELIIEESLLYGHIIFGGLFASVAYNLSAAILRAFGDSKTPLKAIIVSSIINIILDCVAIFVLKTGVEGAAIATVFSQIISAAICIRTICKIEYAKLSKEDFSVNLGMYFNLLKNGVPMAVMNSITAIGCMVVQFFVNGYGVIYTAAYSACVRYINLFMTPACTAGHAMSAYTSQNYGAKEYNRIRRGLFVCLGIAITAYVILGLVMVEFARPLADIFLNSEEAIGLTVQFLHITGVCIFAVDCLFVFRSGVQAMGYPLVPMLSGIAEMALRIGAIVILSGVIGFRATAYAEVSAWTGALLMNMTAFIVILAKKLRESGRINYDGEFIDVATENGRTYKRHRKKFCLVKKVM